MSEYNAKNYTEQGGEKTVIGGTLEIQEGASVTGLASAAAPASASCPGRCESRGQRRRRYC